MPGLVNNTNILNANNQFIQSQNDIEAALLAGSEITSEQLRIMGLWHPYLKYLQYLQAIAEQSPAGGRVGVIPGTFQGDNEIYLSEKCIVSNWIYKSLYDTFNWWDTRSVWEIATMSSSGIITLLMGGLGIAIAGTATLPVGIALLLPSIAIGIVMAASFNPGAIADAIEDKKEEIVRCLYNSVTLELSLLPQILPGAQISNIASDVCTIIEETYDLGETVEKQLVGTIIDWYAMTALFRDSTEWPTAWQNGAPANPVVCGETPSEDCIEGSAQLEAFPSWVWGDPNLLDNGVFQTGQTTAEWDGSVYKVLFRSVLGNPISFTINSISTPSIDFTIHQCDGTYEDRNEVLASEFPITILDALEVHLARVSSAFTVSLEF